MGTESPNTRSIASADENLSLSAAEIDEKIVPQKSICDWLPITSSRNAKWWYSAFHNVTPKVGDGILSLPSGMSNLGRWIQGNAEILQAFISTGILSMAWTLNIMRAAISQASNKSKKRIRHGSFLLCFFFVNAILLHSGFDGLDNASTTVSTISARYTLDFIKQNVQNFTLWKMREDGNDPGFVGPLGLPPWAQPAQPLDTCFMDLPADVHLKILKYLPAVDIAKMACVSKDLRYLSSDNLLWMNKFEEEIAENSRGNCSIALKLPLRFKIASYLTPCVNNTRKSCLCSEFKHFSSNNSSWKPKIREDIEAASKGKIVDYFKKFYVVHKAKRQPAMLR